MRITSKTKMDSKNMSKYLAKHFWFTMESSNKCKVNNLRNWRRIQNDKQNIFGVWRQNAMLYKYDF